MKFHIYRTSSLHIHDENFRYKPCTAAYDGGARDWWTNTNSDASIWRVNISSLEDLQRLQKEVQYELIIDLVNRYPNDCDGTIEIYDYPRE